MKQYQDLLKHVLENGKLSKNRTGTRALSVFGYQMRFDLSEGFPVVSTKRTFWRGAFVEMLWFLRGETTTKFLHEHGVHIWDEWANEDGELGPIYGKQWRDFSGVDQIRQVVEGLIEDPASRRHVVSAWNPKDLPNPLSLPHEQPDEGKMALAPCHTLLQFHVDRGNRLSCQLYQRSADVFLGVPFNIAGYALLMHMVARKVGCEVGDFVWTGGDVHIYENHIEQCKTMLDRQPMAMPKLVQTWHPTVDIWDVEPEEVFVTNYQSHGPLAGGVAV